MILHITNLSSESLQQQIVRQIRAKILTGELAAEYMLPSIRTLAKDYHVSIITVQKAYEELVNLELIIAQPGKGFFVQHISEATKQVLASDQLLQRLEPIINDALNEGLNPKIIKDIINKALNTKTSGVKV